MKRIFEKVIGRGGYDLQTMLERVEEYHIDGRITAQERDELASLARKGAKLPVNAEEQIGLLWTAIRELTARVAALEGNVPGDDGGAVDGGSVAEFKQPSGAHDAYYAGDLVRYGDAVYECIAPEGVACVWSPDVMPDYWELVDA